MDVAPILILLNSFITAAQTVAPAIVGLGFIARALQFLIAHVVGSPRGQEVAKGGMVGSVLGLVAAFLAPQVMAAVHTAFGS